MTRNVENQDIGMDWERILEDERWFQKGRKIVKKDTQEEFVFVTKCRCKREDELKNYSWTVVAKDIAKNRLCFLKFVLLYEGESFKQNNMKREGKFQFYYPYLEHVYENFFGTMEIENKFVLVYGVNVEYIDGMTYADYRINQTTLMNEGKLTQEEFEKQTFLHMMQFLYAVNYYINYAEQPYLHRDLKPENLMVRKNGDIVIIDFDFAHISNSKKTLTVKNWDVAKSEGYTDPIVMISKGHVTNKQTDIYSMGRIFFFMLNGYDYFDLTAGELNPASLSYYGNVENIALGFGMEKDRFKKEYQTDKYENLRIIMQKMCGNPNLEQRYEEIEQIILDMKKFLSEYYKVFRKPYEEILKLDKMPLLKDREKRKAVAISYEVSLEGEEGRIITLYENKMVNIFVREKLLMAIYNLGGTIYYIPFSVTRRRIGTDFEVRSNDIFEANTFNIEFF